MQMLVLIRKKVHFQSFEEFANTFLARKDCGNYDHGAAGRANAFRGVHARQQSRVEQVRHIPVQDAEGDVARRNQSQKNSADNDRCTAAVAIHAQRQGSDYQSSQEKKRTEVGEGRMAKTPTCEPLSQTWAVAKRPFQLLHAVIDQVVANMSRADLVA